MSERVRVRERVRARFLRLLQALQSAARIQTTDYVHRLSRTLHPNKVSLSPPLCIQVSRDASAHGLVMCHVVAMLGLMYTTAIMIRLPLRKIK